jgi:hypothetical protein
VADKNFKVKSGLNIPITSAAILTTDSDGNISSSATLPVANGGTGQTSANNALNALLPIQSGSTINYALESDGTNTSWQKLYNQTIQNNGTTVTPRGILNIVGGNFTDSSGSDTTTLTLGSSISTNTADYTLTTSDVNKIIEFNSSSDLSLTLPTYSSVPFSYGSSFSVVNRGTGKVNLINQSGSIALSSYSASGAPASTPYNIVFGNNIWLGNFSTSYYKSTDGVTWTNLSQGSSGGSSNSIPPRANFANGIFLLGGATLRRSTDLSTFATVLSTGDTWTAPTYSNGTWLAAGGTAKIARSTDNGLNWTVYSSVAGLSTGTFLSLQYIQSSSTWYAFSTSSVIKSVDDGITWTQVTTTNYIAGNLGYVSSIGSTLINTDTSNPSYRTSTDGATWTSRSSTFRFGKILKDGDTLTTVGYVSGTGLSVYTSTNGTTWVQQSSIAYPSSPQFTILGKHDNGQIIIAAGGTGVAMSFYSTGSVITSYISENNGSYIPAGGRAEIYNYNQNQFFVSGDLGNASSVSSNVTLVSGNRYFVDTTSARTLTLPLIPSVGDEIQIYDASNSALTNNITVASNSNKIQGSVQDLIIDSNAAAVYLTYTGSTYGWAVN